MTINGLTPRYADVRTAHRTVTDLLRDAILSGRIAGGERLVQSEIAATLRVSVTPDREALRDLAGEGLIRVDAFRGATVHSPTIEELQEVYGLRRILVPVAVRHAVARITDDEIAEARSLAEQMKTIDDSAEWLDLNRRFHLALDAPAGQPILYDILRRLADLSALYIGVSISESEERKRADEDHARIVDAYAARDPDAAVALALEHLDGTIQAVTRSLDDLPAPGSEPRLLGSADRQLSAGRMASRHVV